MRHVGSLPGVQARPEPCNCVTVIVLSVCDCWLYYLMVVWSLAYLPSDPRSAVSDMVTLHIAGRLLLWVECWPPHPWVDISGWCKFVGG
jgi:hypothetical protein